MMSTNYDPNQTADNIIKTGFLIGLKFLGYLVLAKLAIFLIMIATIAIHNNG